MKFEYIKIEHNVPGFINRYGAPAPITFTASLCRAEKALVVSYEVELADVTAKHAYPHAALQAFAEKHFGDGVTFSVCLEHTQDENGVTHEVWQYA